MNLVVAALGVLIAGIGVIGLAAPRQLVTWVRSIWRPERLWLAVAVRIALGFLLIYAAPACRFPAAIRALGVITLLAAAIVWFLGAERVHRFVEWWCERPAGLLRGWSSAGIALGAFLIYAGV